MAIARDAHVIASSGVAGTLTWSHTCTGANRMLVVFVYRDSGETVTGVTYNLVALTQGTAFTDGSTNSYYAYYLVAPATGANNIVVTFSGSTRNCTAASISYTGAKQSGQFDATNNTTGTGTSASLSHTTVLNNAWIAGLLISNSGNPTTATGSFTKVDEGGGAPSGGTGWSGMTTLDSNSAIAPPAGTTVGGSWTGSNSYGLLTVSIAPFAAAVNSDFLAFM